MTGPEHSHRAEKLIAEAHAAAESSLPQSADRYAQMIAEAQVHATLALAATDNRSRSGWYGWLVLAVAGVFAGLSIFAYNWLSHWYRPVTLMASTNNLGSLQDVALSAATGSQVGWVQQGVVEQLVVTGPGQGTAEVILPVPESNCPEMAKMLGTSCVDGRNLYISNPVTFTWSKPQPVSSTDGPVASTGLDIASSLAQPRHLGVTITAQTDNLPSVCFGILYNAATLTVKSGNKPFLYKGTLSSSWQPACAAGISNAGISVFVALPGNGLPPAFRFDDISSLAVCATAPDSSLQGFAGQINLVPGGTIFPGSSAMVSLHSRAAEPLMVSLDIGPNSQLSAPTLCRSGPAAALPSCAPATSGSLAVCSEAATSVTTNGGQLVPSAWARYSAVVVPLFGGVVTALVIAPLGVSVQVFMDALKRWRWRDVMTFLKRVPGPFRRRDRGARNESKEVSHAP